MFGVENWPRVETMEGGRGHLSIEDSVDTMTQRLEDNIKSAEEDWLQRPETLQTTQVPTEKHTEKNGKKNSCIDISRDNQWHLTREDLDVVKEGKP